MKIKYANIIILVLTLIGFCLLYEKVIKTDTELECPQELISGKSKVPVISIETSFFGLPLINSLLQDHSGKMCSSECIFIDYTNRSLSIDMYLYHARDIHPDMIHTLHCRKNKAAQVLLSLEAPTNVSPKTDMSVFDFVISYYRTNDVSWIYNKFEPLGPGTAAKDFWSYSDIDTAVNKKSKPLLILVSHCTTDSAREEYIKALAQYIPVTSYGDCSGIECDYACASKAIEEHYFYLAFENSVCNEYVTEKFWNIKKLIVPIVLSRKVIGDVAPAESFIAVDDFKSAGELAMYLNMLMENKEEYIKYFEWAKVYKKSKYLEITGCEICDFAWKLKNKKPVKPLSFDQWVKENECKQDYALAFLAKDEIIKNSYAPSFVTIVLLFLLFCLVIYGLCNRISNKYYGTKI